MDALYDNGSYRVKSNFLKTYYMIINNRTGNVEVKEPALPTALHKADAMKAVTDGFWESKGVDNP